MNNKVNQNDIDTIINGINTSLVHINQLLSQIKEHELDFNEGLDFLSMKYKLLHEYCLTIAFYNLLQVRGEFNEKHPIVDRLIELR